jgi:hypothetical protein
VPTHAGVETRWVVTVTIVPPATEQAQAHTSSEKKMCNNKREFVVFLIIFNVMKLSSADWVEVSHFTMSPEGGRNKVIPNVFQSSLMTKSNFLNHVLAKDDGDVDEVLRDAPEMKMQATTSLIITRKDLERRAQLAKLEEGLKVTYNPAKSNHSTVVDDGDDDDDGILIEDDDIDDERGPYVETAEEEEAPKPKPEPTPKPKPKLKPTPQPQQDQPKSNENLSFSGFVNFLKSIQNSMVFRAARGINDKIQILTSFKNKLLMNIGEHNGVASFSFCLF